MAGEEVESQGFQRVSKRMPSPGGWLRRSLGHHHQDCGSDRASQPLTASLLLLQILRVKAREKLLITPGSSGMQDPSRLSP